MYHPYSVRRLGFRELGHTSSFIFKFISLPAADGKISYQVPSFLKIDSNIFSGEE